MAAGSFPSHEKQLLPIWYHAIIAREWQALPAERREALKAGERLN
jgi:hypothetical protein